MKIKLIPDITFKHFRGDLFGGVTAGIVALPLALAFGLQSGLGAAAGLYGAIFISFFAALFGGTNTQISGPTAPMTAVSMVVVAGIMANFEGDIEKALPAILMVFLLAGLMQIALGVIKVGQYIRYIPQPVVSGFMTGIGVIILITQLLPALGYYPKEDMAFVNEFKPLAEEVILERILLQEAAEDLLVLEDFEETVRRARDITEADIMTEARALAGKEASGVMGAIKLLPRALGNINLADLIMVLLTLIIIYGFKRITKAVPSSLVALIVISAGAFFLLPDYRTIGDIPSGFPEINLGFISAVDFGTIWPYLPMAISLALLGAIDSLLTSLVADNLTKTRHNPDQELFGQGIGNSIAAFFGGIPGAGATIRTVVNIEAGGKTRLSGMIAGLLLLVVLLSLGPVASKVPAAVLAGILISVGIGVMDWRGLRHLKWWPRAEVIVMLLVLGLTVFVGLVEAVLAGFILAAIIFMKKIADVIDNRTKMAPIKNFSREVPWEDEEKTLNQFGDKVYVKHLDGPLFFGFASRFQEMIKALPDVKVVILRLDKVPYVDQSGLYAMEDAVQELQDAGIDIAFVGLHGQPQEMFERFNLVPGLVPKERCFETFADCMNWLKGHLNGNSKASGQVSEKANA
ncbi:MAG: sodium-independent anion transporter [Saprospirales bacterium]|nr:sodium-independent anion transporter [Saprospirales bacterium]